MARLSLLPRDLTFFELFIEAGQNTLEAARLLDQMMADLARFRRPRPRDPQGRAGGRPDHPRHRPAAELDLRDADRPRGHLRPRDQMDDIVDYTEEAADFLALYQIEAPMSQAQALTRSWSRPASSLPRALEHLPDFKGLDRYWIEIHRLENDGDRISRDAVASLFSNGIDPMVVIRWKDMFAVLENAIDATETRGADHRGHRHQELVTAVTPTSSSSSSSARRSHSTSPTASTTPPTWSRHRSRPARRGRRSRSRSPRCSTSSAPSSRSRSRRRSPTTSSTPAVITPAGRLRGPDRGDRLEPDHLVLRPAVELLARADRRCRRLGRRGRRASTRCWPTASSAKS